MLDSVFGYDSPPRGDREDESLSVSYSEATSRGRGRRSPDRGPGASLDTKRRGQEEEEGESVGIPSSRGKETDVVEGGLLPSQHSSLQPAFQANILERMASQEEQSRSASKSHRPKSHFQEERLTQSLVVQGSQSKGQSEHTGDGDWDELVVETTKVKKAKPRKKKRRKAKGEKGSPKGSRERGGGASPGGSSQASEERREGSVDREARPVGAAEREEEEEGSDMAATDSLTGPPSLTLSEPAEELVPSLVAEQPSDPATELDLSVVLEEGGDDVGLQRPSAASGAPLAPERLAEETTDYGVPLRGEEEEVWEEGEGVGVAIPVRTTEGPSLADELRQLQPSDQGGEEGREGVGPHVPTSHPPRQDFSPLLDDFEVIDSDALYGSWTAVGEGKGAEEAQGEENNLVSPITGGRGSTFPVVVMVMPRPHWPIYFLGVWLYHCSLPPPQTPSSMRGCLPGPRSLLTQTNMLQTWSKPVRVTPIVF